MIKMYDVLINIFACLAGMLTAGFVIAFCEAESVQYWKPEVLALYFASGALACANMTRLIKNWKKEKEEISEEVEE